MDGTKSYARDGTLTEYEWSLNDWSDEEENLPLLHDTYEPLAWFTAPHPMAGPSSQYNFELQVFDSNGLGDSDDVRIKLLAENATNPRPIAISEISDDDHSVLLHHFCFFEYVLLQTRTHNEMVGLIC